MNQCKAFKKDGTRCQRRTNQTYCWQHGNEIQKKYCRCVMSVKRKNKNVNAFAICTKSVGRISKYCNDL